MSAITAASDDEMQAEIERLRAENESLKQQLEDEKQARKTWENEAERRSDRYTNDVAALQQQLAAQKVTDKLEDALQAITDFGQLQEAAQDKPFAYYQPNCPTNIMEAKLRDMEASRSDCNAMQAYAKACTEPLYTRPQPVSKPMTADDLREPPSEH